jgi:hypothetical protein
MQLIQSGEGAGKLHDFSFISKYYTFRGTQILVTNSLDLNQCLINSIRIIAI